MPNYIPNDKAATLIASANRVLVIGCSGGGKTWLSSRLAAKLKLEYFSIDRDVRWLPGWKERDEQEQRNILNRLVQGDRWLIDGSGASSFDIRLPRTDLILWVRVPRRTALFGLAHRFLRNFGKVRPDMAAGCPEQLPDADFLSYIWNFEKKYTPVFVQRIDQHGPDVPVATLRSRREMVELLDESALQTRLLHTSELSDNQYEEFIEMCCAAYGEDMASILKKVGAGWHVLGTLDGALVSHAMWVVRELQTGSGHELNTAYVEAVATLPEHQGRGFATIVMQHLQNEMYEYEFSALSPADTTLYERLGWEHWRGELFIRSGGQLEATPDESILVMRLPRTPDNVSLNDSLSAEWRPGEVW